MMYGVHMRKKRWETTSQLIHVFTAADFSRNLPMLEVGSEQSTGGENPKSVAFKEGEKAGSP